VRARSRGGPPAGARARAQPRRLHVRAPLRALGQRVVRGRRCVLPRTDRDVPGASGALARRRPAIKAGLQRLCRLLRPCTVTRATSFPTRAHGSVAHDQRSTQCSLLMTAGVAGAELVLGIALAFAVAFASGILPRLRKRT